MSVEQAKIYLRRMLSDPLLKKKLPVSILVSTGRCVHGLTRAELKTARKDLGLVSESIDGIQVWSLPEGGETT